MGAEVYLWRCWFRGYSGLNGLEPVSRRSSEKPAAFTSSQAALMVASLPFLRGAGRSLYSVVRPLPFLERVKSHSVRLA
jgi:hypothetical protein